MPVTKLNEQQRRNLPILKKMNAEEYNGLTIQQRLDLIISDEIVEKLMGPEPIPTLDIEMDEIQNELQRKMVEEIQCAMCGNFPFKPLECRSCNKLFCKYCQIQLEQGPKNFDQGIMDEQPQWNNLQQKIDHKLMSAGRDGRGNASPRQMANKTPGDYDYCCPNCQARGDFLQEVNKVVRNCIDFCEFPHKCPGGGGKIIWATLGELQAHAQFTCPKFGCDICYRPEFQHMTRAQLYDHIKRDCPEVLIMCQVCNKEYPRGEFHGHQCIKDFYIEKLKINSFDVIEELADKLILYRRQVEGLGLCIKPECVEKHRQSGATGTFYNKEVPEQQIEAYVDSIWAQFDVNNDGYLDRVETRRFIQQTFGYFGYMNRFSVQNYNRVFNHIDKNKSGTIEKHEMGIFVKQMLGAKNNQMIVQNTENIATNCFRCKTVVAGYEDSYLCIYCNETYCPSCLGYCQFYDLEDMENILIK